MRREKVPEEETTDFVDPLLNQTIIRLEQGLAIDENGLDEAWQMQPELYYETAKLLALYVSRRDQAKQNLAVTEATVDREVRHDAAVAGEKTTEKEIESNRKLDKRVIKAADDVLQLQHSVAVLQALSASFEQRGKALKGMSDLYATNYFQSSGAMGGMDEVKNYRAETARREMAAERRKRGL